MRAERDRLDHVAAAIEAAVDHDLGAACDRVDDLRQNVDGAAAVIELAAAVVGNVDALDAVIERDLGVLGGGDALDGERDLELRLDALDCLPVERFLEIAVRWRAAGRR